MHAEYLLFDLLVILGPLALSFDRKVHFYTHWKRAAKAAALPVLAFLIWDISVSGIHWWFNKQYTLDFRLFGLPLGEWLFFVAVPYASLFTWECLLAYFPNRSFKPPEWYPFTVMLALGLALLSFWGGYYYTMLALAAVGMAFWLDIVLQTKFLFNRLALIYMSIITLFTTIFNGYLTARPVVLYDYRYQLHWLVGTIPIEDYLYGLSLVMMITVIYEYLKKKHDEAIRHG